MSVEIYIKVTKRREFKFGAFFVVVFVIVDVFVVVFVIVDVFVVVVCWGETKVRRKTFKLVLLKMKKNGGNRKEKVKGEENWRKRWKSEREKGEGEVKG